MMKALIFLILFVSTILFSAQFEIVKDVTELQNDLTAAKYGHKDVNGDWCAILKVHTDIKDLQFEGFGYEKHDYRGEGIYLVYLQPETKSLKFKKDGYIPKNHNFPFKLQSNIVYMIELKGVGEKIEEIGIVVQTDPANAKVFIDGTEFLNDTQISIGKHTLKATRDGYEPYIEEIEVSAKNIHFEIKLEKVKQAGVLIRTEPEEGTVYINGIKMGNTPLTDFHPTGSYELKIVKEGYVDIIETLEIVSPKTEKSYQLQKNVGKITVITEPEKNMDIYLNGRKTEFKSDYTFLDMPPGKYIVSAKSQFYETAENEIVLDIGQIEEVKLQALSNFGIITINTDKKAEVYLNGNRIYELKDIMLEPQKCNIEVRMKKAETLNESYLLQRNDNKVFNMFPVIPTGTVQVAVLPSDAKIELSEEGGESFSAVGMGIFENVPVGNYKLVITKDKYKTYSKNIIIEEGQTVKETGVRLEEIKEVEVTIESEPSYVNVFIDDELKGTTPLHTNLKINKYRIRLQKQGYKENSYQLSVQMGAPIIKKVTLIKKIDPNLTYKYLFGLNLFGLNILGENNNFIYEIGLDWGIGWNYYFMNEVRIILAGLHLKFGDQLYGTYAIGQFGDGALYGVSSPLSIQYRRYMNKDTSIGIIFTGDISNTTYEVKDNESIEDFLADRYTIGSMNLGIGINYSYQALNLDLIYSKPMFFSQPEITEIKEKMDGITLRVSFSNPRLVR